MALISWVSLSLSLSLSHSRFHPENPLFSPPQSYANLPASLHRFLGSLFSLLKRQRGKRKRKRKKREKSCKQNWKILFETLSLSLSQPKTRRERNCRQVKKNGKHAGDITLLVATLLNDCSFWGFSLSLSLFLSTSFFLFSF